MVITKSLIVSIAQMYTVEQLQAKIVELIKDVETNGSSIISASTGAGASYTRRIEASRLELLELYQAALEYKLNGETVADTGFISTVRFNQGFNR